MNVLIKNMEMPTRCAECWLMDGEDSWCCACRGKRITSDYRYGIKDRPEWCPLVPVPPHGDLIDRKALLADTTDMIHSMMVFGGARVYTFDAIKNAPTIIPAEEGELG